MTSSGGPSADERRPGLARSASPRPASLVQALPRAILFDLDDTILSAYNRPAEAWRAVIAEFAGELDSLPVSDVASAIASYARDFWADPDQHRHWRQRLDEARPPWWRGAFRRLAAKGLAGAGWRSRRAARRSLQRLS